MENAKSSKAKRRWFQFNLRRLSLLVLICAVACGWFVVKKNQANGRREAVEAIRKANGSVRTQGEPSAPAWLVKLLGVDFFADVESVYLPPSADDQSLNDLKPLTSLSKLYVRDPYVLDAGPPSQITDAGLEHLTGLTRLKILYLDKTQVTDAGLEHLTGLTGLRELSLVDTQVTDAGLKQLAEMTDLEVLKLANTQVSGVGLKSLQGMKNLRSLDLTNTKINDTYLESLRFLWAWFDSKQLKVILDGTQITDAGLEHLKESTHYPTELSLRETQVTDAGLEHLKGLTSLTSLNLSGTQVTDAGLEHLGGLTKLRFVEFEGTMVTKEGWWRLLDSLPSRWRRCPACVKDKALRRTGNTDGRRSSTVEFECRFCGYKE